jgi:hypothetical protein
VAELEILMEAAQRRTEMSIAEAPIRTNISVETPAAATMKLQAIENCHRSFLSSTRLRSATFAEDLAMILKL